MRIAVAVAISLAVQAGGCRTSDESQRVAERFMELYYGQASAAEAVKLCTGEAEQKLRREIEALQGEAPDANADRPTVTWSLISHTDFSPVTRTYVYRVVPRTSDVGSLTARVDVVQSNGHEFVAALTEEHSPP